MKLSTSTKALLIAAIGLMLLFIIGFRYGFRANVKEPLTYALELDTAAVISIHFKDRARPTNDRVLVRGTEGWRYLHGGSHDVAASELAPRLLHTFHRLRIKRDMGMIRLLGERYDLTENTLSRITFTDAEGRSKSLDIGSSTFAPGKVGVWTYVRIPDEREVYAVEALLSGDLRRTTP